MAQYSIYVLFGSLQPWVHTFPPIFYLPWINSTSSFYISMVLPNETKWFAFYELGMKFYTQAENFTARRKLPTWVQTFLRNQPIYMNDDNNNIYIVIAITYSGT
jgi:hypothetical protein